MNRLTEIVSLYFDNFTEIETSEPKNYFRVDIMLPDGGRAIIGLENKTRQCSEFLCFNMFNSDMRLKHSDPINGKINVFGDNCVPALHDYLKELKEILEQKSN